MVLAADYESVADENYIRDENVGARINGAAIRKALQRSLTEGVGIFHVHMHDHRGQPRPSTTDLFESRKFVPDFFNATPSMPHGTMILSVDSAFGMYWIAKERDPLIINRVEIIGSPLKILDVRV